MTAQKRDVVYTPDVLSDSNVFELLNPELQKIIAKRFVQPTLPQKLAIPPILERKNVLVIAQTGTGKTESCMIPLFHFWMKENTKPVSILYITPLRSLNRDLLDRMIWWANEIGMDISVRHGDTSQYERKMQVEHPPSCLITTPETLQAILPAKRMKEHLRNVKYVVVDEIHELVDSKRGIQLMLALERLRELCGDFQVVGLSATVGSPEEVAKHLSAGKSIEIIKAVTSKLMEIDVINVKHTAEDEKNAEKIFSSVDTASRVRVIMDLIKQHRSILTFTNTRDFAEILGSRIKTLDSKFPVEVHHSSLSKDVRIKTEREFKDEKIKSIIATSSLQLGIDIGSVDLVIQYMSPRTVSQLIQRVGRSGHEMERISQGVLISTEDDDIFESAVIARKSLTEEIEEIKFHDKSYDVLAHQIVGLTLDSWKIELKKAYEILKRAYPYRNLTFEEFMEVCKWLEKIGLVFLDSNVTKKRRGLQHYFTNLSTIPSLKQFRIFNMLDKSFVGVLDEEFVALHGEVGTTFIVKGEAWRILSIEEDKVFVEPTVDIEAAIPGWEGELIPIPFDIAQEVGALRMKIKKILEKDEDVVEKIKKEYPIDDNSAKKMIAIVKKQIDSGKIVPDDRTVLVEESENTIVMNTCWGTLVNETVGRFLSALLTLRVGSVGMKTDPYRIIFEFQTKTDTSLIKEILFTTPPEQFRNYLELSLSKSNLFEWKFIHVAKRFGSIARDADYGRVRMGRIIDDYVGSPIYKETLKELEVEKLDIERSTEVLKKIQGKEIKIVFAPEMSPISKIGLKQKFGEVIGPEKPVKEIFESFRKRIMQTNVRMVCANCGDWTRTFTVKDFPRDLKCEKCEAKLLGVVHPKNQDILKILKKKAKKREMTNDEMKKFERVEKSADLYMNYGTQAVITLACKGVGPTTASKLLSHFYRNNDDFFRALLNAERDYIRTRKYWH